MGVRSQDFRSELKVGDNCWVSFDYNKSLFSGQPMILANSPAGHRACGEMVDVDCGCLILESCNSIVKFKAMDQDLSC